MARQIGYNFRFRPFRGVGAWVYEGGKGGSRVAWCDSRALVPLGGRLRPVCVDQEPVADFNPQVGIRPSLDSVLSPVIPGNDIRLGKIQPA